MSTPDPQQNVDAIRKILFGQEQQQLEQKIEALKHQLEQLDSRHGEQVQQHLGFFATVNETHQNLQNTFDDKLTQMGQLLTDHHTVSLQKLAQDTGSQAEGFTQTLQTLHADMDSKLSQYAAQTNAYHEQLNASLEQAYARIKQLEDNEAAMKRALAEPFSAIAQYFKH